MNPLVIYISGVITGIYLAQRYNLPNVKKLTDKGINKLKELEK